MSDHSRWRHPHIPPPVAGAPHADSRTPTDGKPYYCVYCGSGWNEFGACEDVRCQLETSDAAAIRAMKEKP